MHLQLKMYNQSDLISTIENGRKKNIVTHLHDGTGQEQHEAPFGNEEHLTLDVKGLVDVLEKWN